MKSSKYNYIVEDGDGVVFYNGITHGSFRINHQNRHAYETIINHPDDNYESFKSFIDKMLIEGFVIDDSVSEEDLVMQKYAALKRSQDYTMMILPTYECNVRCWYCIQKHANMWLSDEDVDKIKRRIKTVLKNEDIENFQISWFGGEPLLAYNRIIEISEWAIGLCDKLNKKFYANITTNGTLLTKERIEKLRQLGVVHYQITIDGDKLTHDEIKVLGMNSAFDTSVANIAEIAKHTPCILRFNYTKENLKPDLIISDMRSRLPEEIRKNIKFLIYKVWQENGETVDLREVHRLANMAAEAGFQPSFESVGMCYSDQKYFDCVFPNGRIGKCDNADPNSTHVCGVVGDNGEIIWEKKNLSLLDVFDPEAKATECLECQYLPICWGPCPMKREPMLQKYGEVRCVYANKDKEISEYILNSYHNALYQKRAHAANNISVLDCNE